MDIEPLGHYDNDSWFNRWAIDLTPIKIKKSREKWVFVHNLQTM